MYLLFIFLPFLSFVLNFFFSDFFGKIGSNIISSVLISLNMFLSFFIFYEVVLCNSSCSVFLCDWIDSFFIKVSWIFYFDSLTAIMAVMISVVSFCVHFFSISYMKNDFQQERFMSLLSIFTFFMIVLVTSDNFVQLIFGWEGVGICSYLLINFWSMRKMTNDSALKAIIYNRFGDFCLFMAAFFFYYFFLSLDFVIIFDNFFTLLNNYYFFFSLNDLICILLTIASMAKSAQFVLDGWLLDAMEGPTPVSALIHAATMVTAGVYLLVRFSVIIITSNVSLFFIAFCGCFTVVMCSFIGIDSFDLKKIIANSTASQLGYMFYVCGLCDFSVAICHLFYHAFFKALLFLSAGAIIHFLNNEQDIRCMGGLFFKIPYVFLMLFLGSLALMGTPFIGAFYSKDPLIEISDFFIYLEYFMTVFCATLGAFGTCYYSVRLIYMVFFGGFRGSFFFFHFLDIYTKFSLFILFFFTIFCFLSIDFLIGESSYFLSYQNLDEFFFFEDCDDNETVFLVSFFCILFGILSLKDQNLFFFFNNFVFFDFNYNENFLWLDDFNYFRWFFDLFFVKFFYRWFYIFSDFLFVKLDRGFFEFLILSVFFDFFNYLIIFMVRLHTGFIFHYILFQLIFLFLFFIIFCLFFFFSFFNFFVFYFLFCFFLFFKLIFFDYNLC